MAKQIKLYTCEAGIRLCAAGDNFDAWIEKSEKDENHEVTVTTDEIIGTKEVDGETVYIIKSNKQ